MANWDNIKQEININIADNNSQDITAERLRLTLTDIVDTVDDNMPKKLSDLENDAYFVQDENYVHTDNNFTNSYLTKLNSIEEGAEVNLINSISVNNVEQTITDTNVNITVPTKLTDLVNDGNFVQDANYVHTDNNYTTEDKLKLNGIEAGAEVNVQSNWNESNTSSDAYIQNKPNLTIYFDYAVYDSTTTQIIFKNGGASGTTLSVIDARDFIKDGMIDNVYIDTQNQQLVIVFNTDAGKETIRIDLTDIFDPANYYTKTEINSYLSGKVDKETGKGLSTNDFTTAYMAKLDGIEAGADVNLIESISVNNTTQTITNKNVNITMPTKLTDLTNDGNFVQDANYVHTDQNFTTAYMTKLDNLAPAEPQVRANWTETDPTSYAYILNKDSLYNEIETISYVTSYALNELHYTKVDIEAGKGLSTNDFTTAYMTKLDGIATGAEVNVQSNWNESNISSDAYIQNKPTIPTLTSQLTNDSNYVVGLNSYVTYITAMTQNDYDSLVTKDNYTLYLIKE